ncbi:hypothetical protein [Kitasatospora sp. NPDC096140]|uniref:hypothetical protein n=1 Tax=Kitasatospora sp. NPDC096140 TaxID=3155425 RepID=UPI003318E69C
MPVFPEEPEIHESLPGPGVPFPRESDAQALNAPATGGAPATAPTTVAAPATVPGPRPASPRPAPPRAARPGPPLPIPKPGPAPRRPAPAPAAPEVEVQRIAATPAQALEHADDAIDLLLDAGRDPGTILVLTVGEAHPWQQHELSFGEERYWAQLADGGDVFYADAALARPVRREVVVLVVNGGTPARAAEAYTEALGRATALLVVCGEAGPAAAGTVAAAPAAGRPVNA